MLDHLKTIQFGVYMTLGVLFGYVLRSVFFRK